MVNIILAVGAMIVVTPSLLMVITQEEEFDMTSPFCENKLCMNEHPATHVACNRTKQPQDNCTSKSQPEEYKIDDDLKLEITNHHNRLRSNIASGKISGYSEASKMLKMKWHDTLAEIAGYNARSCNPKHDRCRNTEVFPSAGQNLNSISQPKKYPDTDEFIKSSIQGWFEEHEKCSMKTLEKYDGSNECGHFAQLVRDLCADVGCAVMLWHNVQNPLDYHDIYLVCNYGVANYAGAATYKAGEACSECPKDSKCSSEYPGLCNTAHVGALRSMHWCAATWTLMQLWYSYVS